MNKLNLRQFGRDVSLANDVYTSTKQFNFPAVVVNDVDVYQTMALGDLATGANTTAITANTTAITANSSGVAANTAMAHGEPQTERTIYVNESAIGDEEGTLAEPYQNLDTALSTEILDGTTDDLVFRIAPGTYTGTFSFTKTSANQSISIIGSGSENTFLQGAATWASTIDNLLYLKKFSSVFISNVTIRNCKYGVYTKECPDVVLHNVHFRYCASDGDYDMYKFTNTKEEQAAYWASTKTSNGGAVRLRIADHIEIQNCRAEQCLRGFRVQDVGTDQRTSLISNCMTYNTLESGIYLASASYSQNAADGCTNVVITGNNVYKAFNNGILCIGGRHCTVSANVVQSCSSAGINLWHSVNSTVVGNSIDSTELVSHTGIGTNGDIGGQIIIRGSGNNTVSTGYIATVSHNTMVNSAGVNDKGIFVDADVYPTAINKLFMSNNDTDATTAQDVENAIVVVTSDAQAGGVDQAAFDALETDVIANTTAVATNVTDIAARLKNNTSQTFTGATLKLESNANQEFSMMHTGYGQRLKFHASYGAAGINYNQAAINFYGNRVEVQSVLFRIPRHASTPTETANASFGCIYCDTSTSPYRLFFHDNVSWKEVSLS